MRSDPSITLLLPVALVTIMLGVGLSLRWADFVLVSTIPKAFAAAIVCQAILLPIVCFCIVLVLKLPPAIGLGMMLLAASPGGTSATIYTHLAGGNVAFSIALTAINSVVAVFTLPLVFLFAAEYLHPGVGEVPFQFARFLEFVVLVLAPVAVGLVLRRVAPGFAAAMARPVKVLATVFLIGAVLIATIGQFDVVLQWGPTVGVVALAFNAVSMATGYLIPRLLKLGHGIAVATTFEIGIHNAAFVITLALSVLKSPEMAVPPAIYALVAYLTGAVALHVFSRANVSPPFAPSAPQS